MNRIQLNVKHVRQCFVHLIGVSLLSSCASTESITDNVSNAHEIDFSDWKLVLPVDLDGNGKPDNIKSQSLLNGYSHSNHFFRSKDGGYLFKSSSQGARTSLATRYVRSELREMLRKGNTQHKTRGVTGNNWVLSSASREDQSKAGGVNGSLVGTLAVNRVTNKGLSSDVGRIVVAAVSANKHEPIRLFYRKRPDRDKGSIYFVHEPLNSDDVFVEVIGPKSGHVEDDQDGIALNEKWSYQIDVSGDELMVKVSRPGKANVIKALDISESGYGMEGQFMYFRAGLTVQDNSDVEDDYAQVTYYQLENSH